MEKSNIVFEDLISICEEKNLNDKDENYFKDEFRILLNDLENKNKNKELIKDIKLKVGDIEKNLNKCKRYKIEKNIMLLYLIVILYMMIFQLIKHGNFEIFGYLIAVLANLRIAILSIKENQLMKEILNNEQFIRKKYNNVKINLISIAYFCLKNENSKNIDYNVLKYILKNKEIKEFLEEDNLIHNRGFFLRINKFINFLNSKKDSIEKDFKINYFINRLKDENE